LSGSIVGLEDGRASHESVGTESRNPGDVVLVDSPIDLERNI
jgi:hypothetical protein